MNMKIVLIQSKRKNKSVLIKFIISLKEIFNRKKKLNFMQIKLIKKYIILKIKKIKEVNK